MSKSIAMARTPDADLFLRCHSLHTNLNRQRPKKVPMDRTTDHSPLLLPIQVRMQSLAPEKTIKSKTEEHGSKNFPCSAKYSRFLSLTKICVREGCRLYGLMRENIGFLVFITIWGNVVENLGHRIC